MIRVWDEALLAKSANDYVKDGLVCWLDGINNTRAGHSSSIATWEDLSGNNNDFTSRRGVAQGNALMRLDNAYSFLSTNGTAYVFLSDAFTDAILGTYEFVFSSFASAGNRALFAHQFSAGVCFVSYSSNGIVTLCTNTNKPFYASGADEFKDTINTFSVIPWSAVYKNGLQAAISGSNKTGTRVGGMFFIGGLWQNNVGNPQYAWNGNVYSVRLYNRELTAAEIAQNAEVDRIRFGAGGAVV